MAKSNEEKKNWGCAGHELASALYMLSMGIVICIAFKAKEIKKLINRAILIRKAGIRHTHPLRFQPKYWQNGMFSLLKEARQ